MWTGFLSPTIITTEDFRPDLVITTNTNIYIVELTVGFETNIRKNEERKQSKYTDIINNLSKEKKVLFVNLSMGACGVVGKESGKLFSMLKEFGMNEMESHFLIRKLMNVCIRSTYFIFCKREKAWEGPLFLRRGYFLCMASQLSPNQNLGREFSLLELRPPWTPTLVYITYPKMF